MHRLALLALLLPIIGWTTVDPAAAGAGTAAPNKHGRATEPRVVRLEGQYEAGGAPGSFIRIVDPVTGHFRQEIESGPLSEQSGYDGGPWLRHDGIVIPVDMAGAVADMRARTFLLRAGWRDPAMRRFMRPLSAQRFNDRSVERVTVAIPDASPVELWFDKATRDPVRAVVAADGGPLDIRLGDWRTIDGTRVAFRWEERDPTGQTIRLVASAARTVGNGKDALQRPASRSHGSITAAAKPIPFIFDHDDRGHIVVDATMNGRAARLIFDTGAANFITPEVARSYNLKVGGGVSIGGVGATSMAGGFTRIGRLAIGPATLTDTIAMVAPLPPAATNPRPGLTLHGLVGLEFLSEFRTTIDYGRRTIAFGPFGVPLPPGSAVPFRTDGNAIFIELTVDRYRGWFRVDTGDGGTLTLFKAFAAKMGLAGRGERRVVGDQVGGDVAARTITLRDVTIAGFSLQHVPAEVSEQDAGAFASRTIAGNIGAGLLSRYRIAIDFGSRRLVFAPSDLAPAVIVRDDASERER